MVRRTKSALLPLVVSIFAACSRAPIPPQSASSGSADQTARNAEYHGEALGRSGTELPSIPKPPADSQVPTLTEMVPMRDGITLATNVYLPPSSGPAFPVVLIRTPYGRGNDPVHDRLGVPLNAVGIALVTQDTRRPDQGEGQLAWNERNDGVDTLNWLKSQSWCNGKIGTFGASALGITQVLLAPATRDLACQVIIQAPSDFYSTFCAGGVFQKDLSERYAKLMGRTKTLETQLSHPVYDSYWQQYNAEVRAGDITAPGVHVSGWYDLYPQGAINNFLTRQHRGGEGARGNQKLIMGPWAHAISQNLGDVTFKDNHRFDRTPYVMRFFKHWLLDEQNGIMDEPAVRYYIMGDFFDPDAPGNEWRTADDWPPYPVDRTHYYLNMDRRLRPTPPRTEDTELSYVFDPADPCPTRGGNNAGILGALPAGPLDQRPLSSRSDVLKFETAPLEEPVEISGPIRMILYVSTDAPDTDFTAKLVDIYPDGRELNMADGILRVKFRNGFEKADPLPAGEIGMLEIDMWSVSVIFNKGHKIGVQISSSNWPRFEVNPNTGADLPDYSGETPQGIRLVDTSSVRTANNTVYMDKDHPSALILPVRAG